LLVMVFQDAAYEVVTAMADDILPAALVQPEIVVVGCDGREPSNLAAGGCVSPWVLSRRQQ
jgi:hypothetical protein